MKTASASPRDIVFAACSSFLGTKGTTAVLSESASLVSLVGSAGKFSCESVCSKLMRSICCSTLSAAAISTGPIFLKARLRDNSQFLMTRNWARQIRILSSAQSRKSSVGFLAKIDGGLLVDAHQSSAVLLGRNHGVRSDEGALPIKVARDAMELSSMRCPSEPSATPPHSWTADLPCTQSEAA